jgi:hypothetical protein
MSGYKDFLPRELCDYKGLVPERVGGARLGLGLPPLRLGRRPPVRWDDVLAGEHDSFDAAARAAFAWAEAAGPSGESAEGAEAARRWIGEGRRWLGAVFPFLGLPVSHRLVRLWYLGEPETDPEAP